jgi:hypothetical protein
MVKRSAEDPRLTRLTEVALALPEATRQIYGSHPQFQVRKKTFAYLLDNHHGGGIVAVTCKVLELLLGSYTMIAPKRLAELVKSLG